MEWIIGVLIFILVNNWLWYVFFKSYRDEIKRGLENIRKSDGYSRPNTMGVIVLGCFALLLIWAIVA